MAQPPDWLVDGLQQYPAPEYGLCGEAGVAPQEWVALLAAGPGAQRSADAALRRAAAVQVLAAPAAPAGATLPVAAPPPAEDTGGGESQPGGAPAAAPKKKKKKSAAAGAAPAASESSCDDQPAQQPRAKRKGKKKAAGGPAAAAQPDTDQGGAGPAAGAAAPGSSPADVPAPAPAPGGPAPCSAPSSAGAAAALGTETAAVFAREAQEAVAALAATSSGPAPAAAVPGSIGGPPPAAPHRAAAERAAAAALGALLHTASLGGAAQATLLRGLLQRLAGAGWARQRAAGQEGAPAAAACAEADAARCLEAAAGLCAAAALLGQPADGAVSQALGAGAEAAHMLLGMAHRSTATAALGPLRYAALADVSRHQWKAYNAFFFDRGPSHGCLLAAQMLRNFAAAAAAAGAPRHAVAEVIVQGVNISCARWLGVSPSKHRASQLRSDTLHFTRRVRALRDVYTFSPGGGCPWARAVEQPLVDAVAYASLLAADPRHAAEALKVVVGSLPNPGVTAALDLPGVVWTPVSEQLGAAALTAPPELPTPELHQELMGTFGVAAAVGLSSLLRQASFSPAELAARVLQRWEMWDTYPEKKPEDHPCVTDMRTCAVLLEQGIPLARWDAVRAEVLQAHPPPDPAPLTNAPLLPAQQPAQPPPPAPAGLAHAPPPAGPAASGPVAGGPAASGEDGVATAAAGLAHAPPPAGPAASGPVAGGPAASGEDGVATAAPPPGLGVE
eukprot:TRINITY_DN12120_c0_g1_i2.p1 TRINITY_DN12120_c0_g1~~TRINITY_DN12120_c0_g1_i2.p1  ORF type:complete len:731 (+),score=169.48 TRINITY_DN12120_c0_g1_i2:88-2280(+)